MDKTLAAQLKAFQSGESRRAFAILGCHRAVREEHAGYLFRVWAPNAKAVSVVGDFNFWNPEDLPMTMIGYGVWEAFSVYAQEGQAYKYAVTAQNGNTVMKMDPYGTQCCALPETSSRVCSLEGFVWHDAAYRRQVAKTKSLESPLNIYEVHAGSWKRHEDGTHLNFVELGRELAPYCKDMGYTHIELLPIMEHPYEPSWGYQVTGYYAPTHRFGTPQQLMEFVDICHQNGLGVILDWVPAHFPKDLYGLYEFDGTCCYELQDPLMREHAEWGTRIFDYGRGEVASFLISNVIFWLEQYHVDGIRVDAVASMLYLDYNRREYHPNRYGGKENLEAIDFLRKLNAAAFEEFPSVLMIAEESTAFPMITKPGFDGGLGFLYKWNMGWMNDMLQYMSMDPLWRKGSHNNLTFTMTYAYSENFILPISHDEVVYGKCSMLNKMPGSYDEKFANLRTFYGFMAAHPGKKLSFMGNEFAQFDEWKYASGLDWQLLGYERHQQMQDFVKTLNHFYLDHPAFWQNDTDWTGFQWLQADDRDNSVVAFRRVDRQGRDIVVVCNFCPVLREGYQMGVPKPYWYEPVLTSSDPKFGGDGVMPTVAKGVKGDWGQFHYTTEFTIPPLSVTYYLPRRTRKALKEK
ncbi:MAG TPA: 1,4-alpha-glucan branching protein GlgB [Candidatus Avoscillospira stercoripullorum]|uniref:1,4-alpha-glucan branching enzyme GlgB n=1 Tax=Candidatus Avoscillospira stercoripullorum TaxID=2840709 RepID=A0A9D1A8E9_9FIRM|nr:1,4-alpha-glucan branching protein GlgB [Candidatus Avoscillospira stercoripullorum]